MRILSMDVGRQGQCQQEFGHPEEPGGLVESSMDFGFLVRLFAKGLGLVSDREGVCFSSQQVPGGQADAGGDSCGRALLSRRCFLYSSFRSPLREGVSALGDSDKELVRRISGYSPRGFGRRSDGSLTGEDELSMIATSSSSSVIFPNPGNVLRKTGDARSFASRGFADRNFLTGFEDVGVMLNGDSGGESVCLYPDVSRGVIPETGGGFRDLNLFSPRIMVTADSEGAEVQTSSSNTGMMDSVQPVVQNSFSDFVFPVSTQWQGDAPVFYEEQPSVLVSQFLRETGNPEIVRKVQFVLRERDSGEVHLVLRPESLGIVRINFVLSDGCVSGRFVVENSEVKLAFDENMVDFRNRMQDKGFVVGDMSVSVGGGEQRQSDSHNSAMAGGGRSVLVDESISKDGRGLSSQAGYGLYQDVYHSSVVDVRA